MCLQPLSLWFQSLDVGQRGPRILWKKIYCEMDRSWPGMKFTSTSCFDSERQHVGYNLVFFNLVHFHCSFRNDVKLYGIDADQFLVSSGPVMWE